MTDDFLERIADLAARLVEIDSTNPSLVPGGAGESAIAAFVAQWLQSRGLEVTVEEIEPARPNVVAVARGSGGGRSLMLNAHMDTVGPGGMADPCVPRRDGDRLHGRGAFDMKASLAAIMLVGEAAASADWRGDLIVTAVADEEYSSIGTARIASTMSADAAIVTEPTGLELCVAHKGFAWLEIETRGIAAHGSLPDDGIDAIAAMGPVLTGLSHLQERLGAGARHPLLGAASVHASLISGGTELSTYPDRCTLGIERRTIPGETPEAVEAEFGDLLSGIAATDPRFEATLEMGLVREPFEVDPAHPFPALVREIASRDLGRDIPVTGAFGWMDSALLAAAGIPTVIFGPDGAGAHADEEWVDLPSAAATCRILLEVAREFCR
jgi:acetylornithine deacetylase